MKRCSRLLVALVAMVVAAQGFCGAAPEGTDWAQWRGPTRNGMSPETDWNPEALNNLKILWHKDVGSSYTAVTVEEKHLYAIGRQGKRGDVLYCLRVKDGKEVWTHTIENKSSSSNAEATPVIDGDRLFVQSPDGLLECLDKRSGEIVWQTDLVDDFQAVRPQYGLAATPIVWNDRLVVNAGVHGMAIDKRTGELVWGEPGLGSYATASLWPQENPRQALIFGFTELNMVDLESGKLVWSYPWFTEEFLNTVDPLVIDDRVLVTSQAGCALLRLSGDTYDVLWKNYNLQSYFSSSLILA